MLLLSGTTGTRRHLLVNSDVWSIVEFADAWMMPNTTP
jgi:hypothetical protein